MEYHDKETDLRKIIVIIRVIICYGYGLGDGDNCGTRGTVIRDMTLQSP